MAGKRIKSGKFYFSLLVGNDGEDWWQPNPNLVTSEFALDLCEGGNFDITAFSFKAASLSVRAASCPLNAEVDHTVVQTMQLFTMSRNRSRMRVTLRGVFEGEESQGEQDIMYTETDSIYHAGGWW